MQSITYVTDFNTILKIQEMESKNPFSGIFSKVFWPRPSNHPMPRPNLLSNERSHGDTHRAKFHYHNICGSQVINFKKVSWR